MVVGLWLLEGGGLSLVNGELSLVGGRWLRMLMRVLTVLGRMRGRYIVKMRKSATKCMKIKRLVA